MNGLIMDEDDYIKMCPKVKKSLLKSNSTPSFKVKKNILKLNQLPSLSEPLLKRKKSFMYCKVTKDIILEKSGDEENDSSFLTNSVTGSEEEESP